ncbi:MAG: peroxidase-related enzyme [Patulibacter minatonensis]
MTYVHLVDRTEAIGEQRVLLDEIQGAFGTTPAMFRAVANSPAALRSIWGAFGALGGGTLSPLLAEQIAVAVADRNRCEYCLAAHTALGRKAGATGDEMAAAQRGESDDPRTAAVLAFALALVEERGSVGGDAVATVRANAGLSDEEIVEVVAHVALNLFTNYVNVALDVPVDFPSVRLTGATA